LSRVLFEAGSRCHEIGLSAFEKCSSLKAICIPSFVRTLSADCFHDASLCVLEFQSPSHLLELPLDCSSSFRGTEIQIPDSVLRISFALDRGQKHAILMLFGRGSRLVHFRPSTGLRYQTRRVFARFSEATLKSFRAFP
jgi:hypothetical protein